MSRTVCVALCVHTCGVDVSSDARERMCLWRVGVWVVPVHGLAPVHPKCC
jgi:hypothetical protein